MLTAFCIMLLILGILTLSIISEIKVSLDAYGGENYFSFSIFGIKFVEIFARMYTDIRGINVELINKGENIASIPLEQVFASPEKLMPASKRKPLSNLDLVELDYLAEYGDGNAYSTTMVSLLAQKVVSLRLLSGIINQKVKLKGAITPNFQKNAMNLRLSGIFYITLADIIYGVVFQKKENKSYDN